MSNFKPGDVVKFLPREELLYALKTQHFDHPEYEKAILNLAEQEYVVHKIYDRENDIRLTPLHVSQNGVPTYFTWRVIADYLELTVPPTINEDIPAIFGSINYQ